MIEKHPMQAMSDLPSALTKLMGRPMRAVDIESVGGGCISEAMCVRAKDTSTGDVTRYFVKRNSASMAENFACELEGLKSLAEIGTCRIPTPIATGVVEAKAFLILEWIDSASQGGDFFHRFGSCLAAMHQKSATTEMRTEIGWHQDNYLGAARQVNSATDSWHEFVAENRIGFQLGWAVDQGLADTSLRKDTETIIRAMQDLLSGREETTSLLHGDLWSGNYLADSAGDPVLIDPAVYRGCREMEWGMIRLFGGCGCEFETGYQDVWPMNDGWQRRTNVYVLYHLLNHLNLFGGGYLGQCRSLATQILSG